MDVIRLDKWLWAARFFKTRAIATKQIRSGKIIINNQKPKPSRLVQINDKLIIKQAHRTVIIQVLILSSKRGNAKYSIQMYNLETETLNAEQNNYKVISGHREKGAGRPTKRERRKLNDIDW